MQWFGLAAFILIIIHTDLPGKISRLESKVKKLEKKLRGDNYMSKLIDDLLNKRCVIQLSDNNTIEEHKIEALILDVDEEWVKVSYIDYSKKEVVRLIRIEFIDSVELIEG